MSHFARSCEHQLMHTASGNKQQEKNRQNQSRMKNLPMNNMAFCILAGSCDLVGFLKNTMFLCTDNRKPFEKNRAQPTSTNPSGWHPCEPVPSTPHILRLSGSVSHFFSVCAFPLFTSLNTAWSMAAAGEQVRTCVCSDWSQLLCVK